MLEKVSRKAEKDRQIFEEILTEIISNLFNNNI